MNKSVVVAVAFVSVVTSASAEQFSADELARRNLERCAVEAVIWGMPAVNTELMRQEMLTKTAGKKSNWVPTDRKRGFELMFRLYAPKKEFFGKVWVLPDVEPIAAQ